MSKQMTPDLSKHLGWAEITHPFHPLRGQRYPFLKRTRIRGVETLRLQGGPRPFFRATGMDGQVEVVTPNGLRARDSHPRFSFSSISCRIPCLLTHPPSCVPFARRALLHFSALMDALAPGRFSTLALVSPIHASR